MLHRQTAASVFNVASRNYFGIDVDKSILLQVDLNCIVDTKEMNKDTLLYERHKPKFTHYSSHQLLLL